MIGIETGDDDVLSFVNKGYTAQDILDAGRKWMKPALPTA